MQYSEGQDNNSELFLRPNLLIKVSQNKTDSSHPEKAGAAYRLRLIFDDIKYTRMSNSDYHFIHPSETASRGAKGVTRGRSGNDADGDRSAHVLFQPSDALPAFRLPGMLYIHL